MFHRTEDLRSRWTKVGLPPVFIEEEFPEDEGHRPVIEVATSSETSSRGKLPVLVQSTTRTRPENMLVFSNERLSGFPIDCSSSCGSIQAVLKNLAFDDIQRGQAA